jgi:hypothetical protein
LATVLLINIYRTPVSGVFRRKDSGFAVCGENLASISQFVAGIRHGRQSKPKSMFGSAVTATNTMIVDAMTKQLALVPVGSAAAHDSTAAQ